MEKGKKRKRGFKRGKPGRPRGVTPRRPVEKFSGKPELLVPAGNLESFFSAIDGGADAIYVGLPRFNARIRAENFSVPDLAKLIPYAHSLGIRVYITVNTQILEEELPQFIDLVSSSIFFSPDAFIVGDLGAAGILNTHFPHAEIHASTMMGNFNGRILHTYSRMGITRAILERHLDFEQVKEAVRRSPIHVEVFVHGAMCFSYSGACLFSSFLGGRSGNRGECVQPCRRVYRDESLGAEGSFMSAKDLSLMGLLPDLMGLGIRAFKIEGRMRGADYVRDVARAYRKAIDMMYAGKHEEGVREGEAILASVIGREEAGGVISGEEDFSVVTSEISGAVGEFIGKVGETRGPFVLVEGDFTLKKGERLRVQEQVTGKGTGFTLLQMEMKGPKLWIKVPFRVRRGDLLFRVSSRSDRKRVTELANTRFSGLPSSGYQFRVSFKGQNISVSGRMGGFERKYRFRVEGKGAPSGHSAGLLRGKLVEAYRGDFPLGEVSVHGEIETGPSPGDIVTAFQKASKSFDKAFYLEMKKKRVGIMSSLKLRREMEKKTPTTLYAAVDGAGDAERILRKVDYLILSVGKSLVRNPHRLFTSQREKFILSLPFGQSDALVTFFMWGVKKFVRMGFKKFMIPDIGWIRVFKEAGVEDDIEVISDHYLYAFNIGTCLVLQNLGVSRFVLPLETTMRNLKREAKFLNGKGIVPVFMNVPLLVTRLKSQAGEGETDLVSKKGERFRMVTTPGGTSLFPSTRYSASGHMERFMSLGITDFLVDLRGTDPGEADSVLEHVLKDREIPGTSTFNLNRDNF